MVCGFWWAYGHIALSSFTEALYDISNWTVQSDQVPGLEWRRPGNESDIVEEAVELVTSLSENVDGYGNVNFNWKLRGLTPMMVNYVIVNRFNYRFSALATVRTYNRATGAFECYHATAQRKLYRDGAEAALGGYDNLDVTFVKAQLLHSAHSSGFNVGHR